MERSKEENMGGRYFMINDLAEPKIST